MIRKLLKLLLNILQQTGVFIIFTHEEMNTLKRGIATDEVLEKQEKVTGKIKWFSAEKGMGFVTNVDSNIESFVHKSNIKGYTPYHCPLKGDLIKYNEIKTPKGVQAKYIELL